MLGPNAERIDLLRPDRTTIRLDSIIHSLGHINRYLGDTVRPYSVLEHSVLVARIAYADAVRGGYHPRADRIRALAAIHDAHEAYVGDTPTPVKEAMRQILGKASPFDLLEQAWEFRIAETLASGYSSGELLDARGAVKRADMIALWAERLALLPPGGEVWPVRDALPAADRVEAEQLANSIRYLELDLRGLAVEFRRYLASGGMLGSDGTGVWPGARS